MCAHLMANLAGYRRSQAQYTGANNYPNKCYQFRFHDGVMELRTAYDGWHACVSRLTHRPGTEC
jgi:hypothetical protein